ncbi:hypothetical protein DAEQUDRAFT_731404 [Daedalea quercina L-15889]|uniref:Uncharacterized protein n=1 Tax=Daedalea quercina L-15889 TaxID=1314783 RepID=A0A165MBS4_9APHY|nr:hypothetical protein DAEQUDRAFT_731404 [Daedalea quercina L-15889]
MFHVTVGGFTALRAYAISGRSLPLAVVIIAFSLVPIAVNIYEISITLSTSAPWPVGCVTTVHVTQEVDRCVSILSSCINSL